MRVIAGEAKGRRLKAPTSGTRPMADRMREALFSALGDIEGLEVLDLYAGSGSLGLEALSRGAAHAMFVELARDAILKLQQNVDATGLADRSEVEWGDVASVLSRSAPRRVDLIFVDPPYGNNSASVQRDLEALVTGGWLSDTGRIVVHRPAKEFALDPLGLTLSWERAYGQSHIYVFSHEPEEG
jgi:16S rRNA (guanine966-N2)-methyltransferase